MAKPICEPLQIKTTTAMVSARAAYRKPFVMASQVGSVFGDKLSADGPYVFYGIDDQALVRSACCNFAS
jgi:hypothetical protein